MQYCDPAGRHAVPGVDYEFQNNIAGFLNFTIPAGTNMSFEMTIIDDNIAEYDNEVIVYAIGVYESDQLLYCDYGHIYIFDNDGEFQVHACSVQH